MDVLQCVLSNPAERGIGQKRLKSGNYYWHADLSVHARDVAEACDGGSAHFFPGILESVETHLLSPLPIWLVEAD